MNWFAGTAVAGHDLKLPARGLPEPVRFWLLFAGCGITCALTVLKPILGLSIIAVVIGSCVVVYLLAATLSGKIEPAILTWVLIFPLGYYFLSFPRDKSIITLDRVLPAVLLLAIGLASRDKSERLPRPLRRCAIAWTAFLIFATASLMYSSNLLVSGRLLVDAFCLPALLGWCVLRSFDVRRYAAALHIAVSVMAFYAMCIGAAEEVV